jgi:predicted MFS family arabinose efflux permease
VSRTGSATTYLGRVFGLIGATGSLALLVSILIGGALGETFDPRNLLNVTVAMDLVTALAAFVLFRSAEPREQAIRPIRTDS